jgi:UPF0271 protein
MMGPSIDLNCDLGESYSIHKMPYDAALMDYITSANIACGFHAGDYSVMQQTVAMAIKKGVAIGAHPGLPDLQGFGRRDMNISVKEAYQITLYQVGALYGFVKAAGGKLHHVKAHGALYNRAARDIQLATAIAAAVYDFDPSLIIYGLSGSEMINAAKNKGMATASEVFADRSYQDDGSLTPRNREQSAIPDLRQCQDQVLMMVSKQQVLSLQQKIIPIRAETLCLHGDTPYALELAALVHQTLTTAGIHIQTPTPQ